MLQSIVSMLDVTVSPPVLYTGPLTCYVPMLLIPTCDSSLNLSLLPGNGIAALHSVPTAIFCVLHCLQPRECLPESYGGLERTIAYSLALGGDTDTIACMAGAIAGAHYGIEGVPQSWMRCCEGAEDADMNAKRLHMLYHQSSQGGGNGQGEQSCANGTEKKTETE